MAIQSSYVKLSLVILGLSCYLMIVHLVLYEVNPGTVGVLLPTAVCCFVTALAILFGVYMLPQGKISTVLKILTAVLCVIGGIVELSGIIVWNESWREAIDPEIGFYVNIPTNKPYALRLRHAANNVHLVVNVLLAYITVLLLLVDVWKTARETDPANPNESNVTGSSAAVQPQHHSVPKQHCLVKVAGFLLLLSVVVPAFAGHRFWEHKLYARVKGIHYESVSVLVPMAFCFLVVSFLLISWISFCRHSQNLSRFAKILAAIGGFIGGVLEFVSVVILGCSIHQAKDAAEPGRIIETARLGFTVPLTLVMLSAISAAISALLIIVELFVKKQMTRGMVEITDPHQNK